MPSIVSSYSYRLRRQTPPPRGLQLGYAPTLGPGRTGQHGDLGAQSRPLCTRCLHFAATVARVAESKRSDEAAPSLGRSPRRAWFGRTRHEVHVNDVHVRPAEQPPSQRWINQLVKQCTGLGSEVGAGEAGQPFMDVGQDRPRADALCTRSWWRGRWGAPRCGSRPPWTYKASRQLRSGTRLPTSWITWATTPTGAAVPPFSIRCVAGY